MDSIKYQAKFNCIVILNIVHIVFDNHLCSIVSSNNN